MLLVLAHVIVVVVEVVVVVIVIVVVVKATFKQLRVARVMLNKSN